MNPFAGLDLAAMDREFLDLTRQADWPGGPLSPGERALFRLGVLAGAGAWPEAGRELGAALAARRLGRATAARALEHVLALLGACAHSPLARLAEANSLALPADMPAAVTGYLDGGKTLGRGRAGRRKGFALGLGVTCGARCWDT